MRHSGFRRALLSVTVISCLLVSVGLGATRASATPGAPDPSFGTSGIVVHAANNGGTGVGVVTRSGAIVVSCCSGSQAASFQVNEYNSSGAAVWQATPFSGAAESVAVDQTNGDIAAAGYESTSACGGSTGPAVALFNSSGAMLWHAFVACASGALSGTFSGVAFESNGDVVATGNEDISARTKVLEAAFSPSGASIGSPAVVQIGSAGSAGQAVAVSASGTDAIVAGYSYSGATRVLTLAAFNVTTGALDTGFGTAGVEVDSSTSNGDAYGVAVVAGGNIVAAGTNGSSYLLEQFTPTGGYDTAFGTGGIVRGSASVATQINSIAYQAGGGILVGAGQVGTGRSEQGVIAEWRASSGAADTAFGSGGAYRTDFLTGPGQLNGAAAQADGKAIGVGSGPYVNAVPGEILVRVLGPTISVGSLSLTQVTSYDNIAVSFPVTISPSPYSAIVVELCGSAGVNVDGQGSCAHVTVGAGVSTIRVPVSMEISAAIGFAQTSSLVGESSGGVAANPGHNVGSIQIQHVNSPPKLPGYRFVASDGGVFSFGKLPFEGSTGGVNLKQPIVGMAATSDGLGYWMVASDGGIFAFGDAHFYGSTGGVKLKKPIVAMAATPDDQGYWLVASDGGVFAFGDAHFYGSTGGVNLKKPIVDMAATADGKGYWMVASDGGIFAFGDAVFEGSTGGVNLKKPIVAMARYPGGPGYWMVASDGGIFSFGDAGFHGSTGGDNLTKPVVGMLPTYNGQGYWLVASDGGVFNYGNATFYGSTGGVKLKKPIVGITG